MKRAGIDRSFSFSGNRQRAFSSFRDVASHLIPTKSQPKNLQYCFAEWSNELLEIHSRLTESGLRS